MLNTLLAASLYVACPQDPDLTSEQEAAPPLFQRLESNGLAIAAVTVEPGVSSVGVALTVGCGLDHDPAGRTGLAEVVASALRLHFAAVFGEPGEEGTDIVLSVRASRTATTIAASVGSDRLPVALEALRSVVDGSLQFDADIARRAVAQARLRADDEAVVLPGTMLRARAARRVAAGTPAGRQRAGIPDELKGIDAAALSARLVSHYAPATSTLAAVGAVDQAALRSAVESWPSRDVAAFDAVTHDSAPSFEDDDDHSLVDAPFVTAALPARRWGEVDFAPFLIAVGVLRARAARAFGGYRGGELRAQFPFVHFDAFEPSAAVTVNRRGRDGDSLERVKKEMDGIFADLRSHGAAAQEIAYAAAEVAQRLSLPVSSRDFAQRAARQPRILQLRAVVLAHYRVFGWPRDFSELLKKTPVTHVARVLREMTQPEAITWLSLR